MHRKLKVLGLALVAALALTAVMASAASAQFTSDKEHTILSGSQRRERRARWIISTVGAPCISRKAFDALRAACLDSMGEAPGRAQVVLRACTERNRS